MKKTTLILLLVFFTFMHSAKSQVTLMQNAPASDGSTTSNRAPNGTSGHSFLRASLLALTTELAGIPSGSSISEFGLVTSSGSNIAVTGTLIIYMKNSTDATFTLGTNWATITSGMTQVYSGTYTIPANATNVDVTLSTPFTYTGGSVYVAFDFVRTGTAATTAAVYQANSTGLTGGCVSAASATAAPTTLSSTNFRPVMRFGYLNPNSNDVAVEGISSLGNVATALALPVPISAVVTNKSNTTLTNISVTASMTGANTYNDLQTIASLAPGVSTTVTFTNWTPTALGANVLNVSVPSDQVNTNNSFNFNTTTNCYNSGAAQNPVTYTGALGFNTGSGIISTPIQNSTATTISAVNIAISNNTPSTGNNVFAVVLDNTGAILAQSPNLTLTNSDLNTIKTFTFSSPVSVAANQIVHIGLGQTANATTGYYPLASYANTKLTTVYNTCAITGGALTALTSNLGEFGIEAVYSSGSCTLGVDNVSLLDNKLIFYPNPTNSILNVELDAVNNCTVEIYNSVGQIVLPIQKVYSNAFEINVSSLSNGIYFLKIINDKEISNVKFAIEK